MKYTIQPSWPRKAAPIGQAEFDEIPPVGLILVIDNMPWRITHIEAHLSKEDPRTVERMTIVVARGGPGDCVPC